MVFLCLKGPEQINNAHGLRDKIGLFGEFFDIRA